MARVTILPDRWFARDGQDLVLKVPLNLAEAALGTTISALLPDGPVQFQFPPGTRERDQVRVPARGLPGRQPGDLVVVAEVVMPENPTLEERSALRALLSVSPNARTGWPAAVPSQ
jgi:DnaJ-class molecular chaperone